MSKKKLTINVGSSVISSSYDGGQNLLITIDGRVFNVKEFIDYLEALNTVHTFHDMWKYEAKEEEEKDKT